MFFYLPANGSPNWVKIHFQKLVVSALILLIVDKELLENSRKNSVLFLVKILISVISLRAIKLSGDCRHQPQFSKNTFRKAKIYLKLFFTQLR